MNDIRIVALADPGDAFFDEQRTPFLVFGEHAEHGEGWTLWYLDENGVPADQFVGGQIDDGGWAVAQAREWLRKVQP